MPTLCYDSEYHCHNERIHNWHRILIINIATGQTNSETNRNTQSNKPIPRRQYKRSKIAGENPGEHGVWDKKHKMEILITDRTDLTPLLGMDWIKAFKITIGRIQLAENNQSERVSIP